jgi:hypothetical protein
MALSMTCDYCNREGVYPGNIEVVEIDDRVVARCIDMQTCEAASPSIYPEFASYPEFDED